MNVLRRPVEIATQSGHFEFAIQFEAGFVAPSLTLVKRAATELVVNDGYEIVC